MTMDGRTWFGREPEFASVIRITFISASELDLIELGPRASVAYCQAFADRITAATPHHVRMLHPVEWERR